MAGPSEGRSGRCSLRVEVFDEVNHCVATQRSYWEGTLDPSAGYFDDDAAPGET